MVARPVWRDGRQIERDASASRVPPRRKRPPAMSGRFLVRPPGALMAAARRADIRPRDRSAASPARPFPLPARAGRQRLLPDLARARHLQPARPLAVRAALGGRGLRTRHARVARAPDLGHAGARAPLRRPPGQDLAAVELPRPGPHSVDVFIPTYDESPALLRKTILAARELRLPHRTWVLDDGRRPEVRELCDELGVGYLTRDSNEHAKAGNLNAALARTDGEFVVVLDADFIALPQLLERTLGHFERDERLALVQLPQTFYNVDSIQHVDPRSPSSWHEQSLFYDVIQPGKNRWNAAFWCGSPAVLRRAALESIGGVATSTVTEDILTSMRLHAAGWRTLYHDEVLAVGVAPGDLDGFQTQRLRWAQGSMQILRSRENPLCKRGLTLAQRLNYLASMTTYFQALQL